MKAKKIIMVCLMISTIGLLSACSTVKGFGRDVSKAGSGIQRAAQ